MSARFRKGLTLVELIVVMVVVSLLAALMLPQLARAREEENKTKCRENLKHIGLAIEQYAADNGGWTPAIGGGLWQDTEVTDKLHGRYAWEDIVGTPGVFGLNAACHGPTGTSATGPQPQRWLITDEAPARPLGLGLVWARGYLGEKGPKVLFCPGNHSGQHTRERKYDMAFRYDPDEPFWTSKGKIARANDNMIGDGRRAHSTASRVYMAWQCGRAWDEQAKRPEFGAGVCNVWLNYQMRFKREFLEYPAGGLMADGAIKIKEAGRIGIVSDQLDALLGTEPVNNWLGFPINVEPPERYEKIKPLRMMNHDNAFNILFADGSVKTYEDTSGELWKVQVERYVKNGYANWSNCHLRLRTRGKAPTTALDEAIWTPFLDKAGETP